jgi:hypothetical protein
VVGHDVQLYSCRNQFSNHVIEILCVGVSDAVRLSVRGGLGVLMVDGGFIEIVRAQYVINITYVHKLWCGVSVCYGRRGVTGRWV